jgi:hypothetical protein
MSVAAAAEQVEERERRLFFFQNALSKLELDQLELHDRQERLGADEARAEAEAAAVRAETRLTPAQLQAKHELTTATSTSKCVELAVLLAAACCCCWLLLLAANAKRMPIPVLIPCQC